MSTRVTWDAVRDALASRPPGRVAEEVASRAAVAVVLGDAERGIEILFIRRAEHPQDPWSGQMGFPGGRAAPGDPDLEGTAIRETVEEIGIDLAREGELLGSLDEVRAMARMRPMDLAITPFVFRLRRTVTPRLSSEVVSVHWLAIEELLDPASRSTMDYVHQGATLAFPCLRLGELVIWGLTYRMLTGFQDRLGAGEPRQPGAGGRG